MRRLLWRLIPPSPPSSAVEFLSRARRGVSNRLWNVRMKAGNKQVGARLRIVLDQDVAIGPGKADILQGIEQTGSIAAAGRRMGMSYKRAWTLVETMNACFRNPLVETSRGGQRRGGAVLTPDGVKVLACYRRMETLTTGAIGKEMRQLRRMLADISEQK